MSSGRFKSRDDYFARKTNLAKKVLDTHKTDTADISHKDTINAKVFIDLFYGSSLRPVEDNETESPRDAVKRHLSGESTLSVLPLGTDGSAMWHTVTFSASTGMEHPFTKAKTFSDELSKHNIKSLIEVTDEGKGHYRVWIFHSAPLNPDPFSGALHDLGSRLFDEDIDIHPARAQDKTYITLPLQGESVLMQRSVFINSVGKMHKNQAALLNTITPVTKKIIDNFIDPVAESDTPDEAQSTEKPADTLTNKKQPSSKRTNKTKPESRATETVQESPVPPADATDTSRQYIACSIAGAPYTIPMDKVKRVLDISELVPLPESETSLVGIVHERERGIPVIDPGVTLSGEKTVISPKTRIILLQTSKRITGILVEKTNGIGRAFSVTNTGAEKQPFVSGMVKRMDADELIPSVDVSAVIDEGEKIFSHRPESRRIHRDGRFVIVTAGDVWCAFPAESVKEILRWTMMPGVHKTRALPHQVITYEDRVIPLFDLRVILGAGDKYKPVSGKPTRIIILKSGENLTGIRVDSVEGIRRISGKDVREHNGRSVYAPMISGFSRLSESGRVMMILDPDMLSAVDI